MVSVAILGTSIGGLFYTAVGSQYLTNASKNRQAAWLLISSRHEEVSTWTEAYLETVVNTNQVTLVETSAQLRQRGLLLDTAAANSIIDRTTQISQTNNLYVMNITVRYRQSHMGTPTTNLQQSNLIYLLPKS